MSKLSKATLKFLYTEVAWSSDVSSPHFRHLTVRPSSTRRTSASTARPANVDSFDVQGDGQPFLDSQRKFAGEWQTSQKLTSVYVSLLEEIASNGVSFKGQNVLASTLASSLVFGRMQAPDHFLGVHKQLSGVGKGSIGLAIVRCLPAGGAHVTITTSLRLRPHESD